MKVVTLNDKLVWMKQPYGKKMPSGAYITKEEKSVRGFQAAQDRLTLLLRANVSGDVP